MKVTGIIVTRGDHDLGPCFETWPQEWQRIVWNNGSRRVEVVYEEDPFGYREKHIVPGSDLAVYGRYAAIEYASHDLIYVQDDDVIVSDPQAIVDVFTELSTLEPDDEHDPLHGRRHVVCNMPREFRHDFYADHALVGFGAAFHRDAPEQAFRRYADHVYEDWGVVGSPEFHRCCDVVFTALTPRVLVEVPKQNREFAEDADRMYRQPEHVAERTRILERTRRVRDW